MKHIQFKLILLAFIVLSLSGEQCTKLDAKVYSQISNDNFWKTTEQISAGKAPAYTILQYIGGANSGVFWENEIGSDEMITPTRGGDWGDGGFWSNIWYHSEDKTSGMTGWAWDHIYQGVGKCNYIIYTLKNLSPAPASVAADMAEMKALRAFYYYHALNLFGNVPYVSNFKQDPSTVATIPKAQVYDSLVADLRSAIPDLAATVSTSTYGKVNKYVAHMLLAKLYLNAETYTGTPRWQECLDECNAISAGGYSLMPNYFDNFRDVVQETSTENIFVTPLKADVLPGQWGGNYVVVSSIQFNNAKLTFGQNGMGNNGMSTVRSFYRFYDTTSDYSSREVDGYTNVYRTFHDQRTGQFLVGQQYVKGITYPPYRDILYSSSNTNPAGLASSVAGAIEIHDDQSQLPLAYFDTMALFSNPAPYFRMAGLRNIKYWPEPGGNSGDNNSNDGVFFRYSDVLLMKAECQLRLGQNLSDALENVNIVRRRAYSGSEDFDWHSGDLTLDNLYAERAREFAWEMLRREDMIRFGHFLESRTMPEKPADPSDKHTYILPIPVGIIQNNPKILQNPGYN